MHRVPAPPHAAPLSSLSAPPCNTTCLPGVTTAGWCAACTAHLWKYALKGHTWMYSTLSCYLLRHSMQVTGWTSRSIPAGGLGQQLVQGILLVCSPGLPVCSLGLPPRAKHVPVVLHCSCHAQLAPACPLRAACDGRGHTDVACERPVGEHVQQQNRDAQTSIKLSCSCMQVMYALW